MEREPKKEQEPKIDVVNLGKYAINSSEIYHYLADEECLNDSEIEARLVNKLLSESPNWTKSADGHWIYNPTDHKAEYRGF